MEWAFNKAAAKALKNKKPGTCCVVPGFAILCLSQDRAKLLDQHHTLALLEVAEFKRVDVGTTRNPQASIVGAVPGDFVGAFGLNLIVDQSFDDRRTATQRLGFSTLVTVVSQVAVASFQR